MTLRQTPSYLDKAPYFFREPSEAPGTPDFTKKSFEYTVRQLWFFVAFNLAFSILWAVARSGGGKYDLIPRWLAWIILAVPSVIVTLTVGLALLYLASMALKHPVVLVRRVLVVATILFMIVVLRESVSSKCRVSRPDFYCPHARAVFFL